MLGYAVQINSDQKHLHMMMNSLPALIVTTGMLLLTACTSTPSISPVQAQAELQQRQAGFLAALGSKDAAKVAAYFTEDAVMHVANMPVVKGRRAIETFYGNIFRFLSDSTSTPEVLQLAGSADLAYAHGAVTNIFEGQQGRTEFPGKYLLVWKKAGELWLVAAYGVTADRAEARR
jgi:uncharacterized protein (TIGR02246 family)